MLTVPRVLDHTVVPEQELLLHRGDELADVERVIQEGPNIARIVGPRGTGKTLTAFKALHGPLSRQRKVGMVDCWRHHSGYDALWKACSDVSSAVIHRNSTPLATLREHLEEPPDTQRLVVLDEADQLESADILETLLEAPRLDVILITNDDDDLFRTLDSNLVRKIRSGTRLEFMSYPVRELTAILIARAERGLREGFVDDRTLETIATRADGDARVGIALLREAAIVAHDARDPEIDESHINEAFPTVVEQLRSEGVDRLSDHQRTLHDIIREANGPLAPCELREEYRRRVDDPRSNRRVRTWLSKMEQYNLVERTGRTRSTAYRIADYSGESSF